MTCRTCRYWGGSPDEDGFIDASLTPNERLCRRNPPVVVHTQRRRVWPVTHYDDWCGEYEMDGAVEAD